MTSKALLHQARALLELAAELGELHLAVARCRRPRSKRPPVSSESVAASSAMRTGLCSGRIIRLVPRRMRLVRAPMAAAITSGEGV